MNRYPHAAKFLRGYIIHTENENDPDGFGPAADWLDGSGWLVVYNGVSSGPFSLEVAEKVSVQLAGNPGFVSLEIVRQ